MYEAYTILMRLLIRHGLSDQQAASFVRMVVSEMSPGATNLGEQLAAISQRLEEWFEHDAARQQFDVRRMFGAFVGGVGIGVAGNFVSDLIKGDPWQSSISQKINHSRHVIVHIVPSASRHGLREGASALGSELGIRNVSTIASLIYSYATKQRTRFDDFSDGPWHSPGEHIRARVHSSVGNALAAWARDRNLPRGVLCANIIQSTIQHRLPFMNE